MALRGGKTLWRRLQLVCAAALLWFGTSGCTPDAQVTSPTLVVDIPHPVLNGGTHQLKFSPSGRELAVPFMDLNTKIGRWRGFTRLYRIPDGKQLREIDGGWNCAWSPDGELFAVGRLAMTGGLIDLWDAKTWSHLQQLTRELPGSWEPSDFEQGGLCFDRDKDLYVATGSYIDDPVESPSRHVVWWRHGSKYQNGEPIGTSATNSAMSISVASHEDGTRVAISFLGPCCAVEVLRVSVDRDGTKSLSREYTVPAIPREDHVWLQITPDGSHLAALSEETFWLFRLLADHAELVNTFKPRNGSGPRYEGHVPIAARNLDVSADGRLVAYCARDQLAVVRVSDGATILELKPSGGVCALSPDGRLLAYVAPKVIRIVNISDIERTMK